MMETQSLKSELIWLNSKKSTLMEEYTKFERQSLEASEKILDAILILQSNNKDLNKELDAFKKDSFEEKNALDTKI